MKLSTNSHHPASTYVDDLIAHATRLNHEAYEAMAAGREADAYDLLEQAELLAADITQCVDDLESEEHRVLREEFAEAEAPKPNRATQVLKIGLGAGIAAGAMVVEI